MNNAFPKSRPLPGGVRPGWMNRFLSPPPKPEKLNWVPPGNPISYGATKINCGGFYTAIQWVPEEPSAIVPGLPASDPEPVLRGAESGLQPFFAMTPGARGCYLGWLANGCRDTDPKTRSFADLKLYLCGFERRLLVDAAREPGILEAAVALLHHYSAHPQIRALRTCFYNLAHFWAYRFGQDYYLRLMGWLRIPFEHSAGEENIPLLLSAYFMAEQRIPGELAFEAAEYLRRSFQNEITNSIRPELRDLFLLRFRKKFPCGFLLREAGADQIHYHPFNPGLVNNLTPGQQTLSFQDVFAFPEQLFPLVGLWNVCLQDLEAYAGLKNKPGTSATDLEIHQALPGPLRSEAYNPFLARWNDLLKSATPMGDGFVLKAHEVAELLRFRERSVLNAKRSLALAEFIGSFGYCLEPDARHSCKRYELDQEVVVWQPASGTLLAPHREAIDAAAFLELCIQLSAANAKKREARLASFHEILNQEFRISPSDRSRLGMLEKILTRDWQPRNSIKALAQQVQRCRREKVAKLIVSVAAANPPIEWAERRFINRAVKALAPLMETIAHPVNQEGGAASDLVLVQVADPNIAGTPIPRSGVTQPVRQLDPKEIARIQDETREVQEFLSEQFADADTEAEQNPESVASLPRVAENREPKGSAVPEAVEEAHPIFRGLPVHYRAILEKLLTRPSWPRAEFDLLVLHGHLMPRAAYDALNEWAINEFNEYLLSGEEVVTIHKHVITHERI
ncbi:MAG: terB [Verrucomicrobiales bacterium]|nr:terB [Verrucomicrobiales bacterium]